MYSGTVTKSVERRNAPIIGGKLGYLAVGTQVTGDSIQLGWMRLTSHKGWYPTACLAYSETQAPDPEPPAADEYILHVKNGVTRMFVPKL